MLFPGQSIPKTFFFFWKQSHWCAGTVWDGRLPIPRAWVRTRRMTRSTQRCRPPRNWAASHMTSGSPSWWSSSRALEHGTLRSGTWRPWTVPRSYLQPACWSPPSWGLTSRRQGSSSCLWTCTVSCGCWCSSTWRTRPADRDSRSPTFSAFCCSSRSERWVLDVRPTLAEI